MAVLRLVPDPSPSGAVDEIDAGQELLSPEAEICTEPAARMWPPVITPPRAEPAVLTPFLRLATELALRATGAAGCAIAMRAGGGFRCYASVGEAPPANTPVRLAGTLTGLCVRKAKTIRRDDVAEEEAQQSGYAGEARSIVLAPVFQDGNVGGVIGIFSPEPHSFLDEHVTALEQISNVIAVGMLHPERLESAPPSTVAVVQPETRQPDFMPEAIAAQTRALEGLARVITNALLHQQRPTLTAEASNPEAAAPGAAGAPQKKLYGLPCSKCGAYSPSKEPICTVCNQPR